MDGPNSSDLEPSADAGQLALREFHSDVDARASRLALINRERLQCRRGCASCCRDDLAVFEIEAERIRRNHPSLLRDGAPHGVGACAFLDDEGACRIYEDRPYVCRTQGLPLRWFEDSASGDVVERRDICPLNDTGTPLEDLPDDDCWLLGPAEGQLADLASGDSQASAPARVALRSLFHRRT